MQTCAKNCSLISIQDLSKNDILELLDLTEIMKKTKPDSLLKGLILASCFFEPSTRTRLSFESAMIRLGGSVIGFSEAGITSSKKGETLRDTIKMVSMYADAIVLRHPLEGAAQLASEACDKPVINAGDGSHQHPTQTLLDLFTIRECQGSLDDLHIALAGDLKYGRTAHSLVQALSYFKPRLYLVSSPELEMPKHFCNELRAKGVKYSFHQSLDEVMPKIDILYMTRIQKERLPPTDVPLKNCNLTVNQLAAAKPNLRVLHPFPRVDELDVAIDQTPFAYYFQQAENGLYSRQALLTRVLERIK